MATKALLYSLLWCLCSTLVWTEANAQRSVPYPICPLQVRFIPEMGAIPELEWAQPAVTAESAAMLQQARHQWKRLSHRLEAQLTAATARRLSRWAKAEMKHYVAIPPFQAIELMAVGQTPSRQQLLVEGTIATLPSHSGIVLRWLKVYLVYDRGKQCITDTMVTIRGVRVE